MKLISYYFFISAASIISSRRDDSIWEFFSEKSGKMFSKMEIFNCGRKIKLYNLVDCFMGEIPKVSNNGLIFDAFTEYSLIKSISELTANCLDFNNSKRSAVAKPIL